MPGVWDPLSALLAARAGFETVFLSGYAVAGTLLGLPDIGLLTQTEMAEVARRVCAAVPDTVVVVDADTGYGNAAEHDPDRGAVGVGRRRRRRSWRIRCGRSAAATWPASRSCRVTSGWPSCGPLLAPSHAPPRHRPHRRPGAARARRGDRAGPAAADLGVDAVFVEAPESVDELARDRREALTGVTLVANMVETGTHPAADAGRAATSSAST